MELESLLKQVKKMMHSKVKNYAAAGLTSHLIGGAEYGKVRLFLSDRDTEDFITPHSHRFDFTCLVLEGKVTNTIYHQIDGTEGDQYSLLRIKPINVGMGEYTRELITKGVSYHRQEKVYYSGNIYSMTADQIHSIKFRKGSAVFFFEGPEICDHSIILQPYSDGETIPTFGVQSWMFMRI